jgi:hypothetical protein
VGLIWQRLTCFAKTTAKAHNFVFFNVHNGYSNNKKNEPIAEKWCILNGRLKNISKLFCAKFDIVAALGGRKHWSYDLRRD